MTSGRVQLDLLPMADRRTYTTFSVILFLFSAFATFQLLQTMLAILSCYKKRVTEKKT
jgi:hypothetical protein